MPFRHRFINQRHHFSSKAKQTENKKKSKSKPSDAVTTAVQLDFSTSVEEMELARARACCLAEDDRDPSLDLGPNNRRLFTNSFSFFAHSQRRLHLLQIQVSC